MSVHLGQYEPRIPDIEIAASAVGLGSKSIHSRAQRQNQTLRMVDLDGDAWMWRVEGLRLTTVGIPIVHSREDVEDVKATEFSLLSLLKKYQREAKGN